MREDSLKNLRVPFSRNTKPSENTDRRGKVVRGGERTLSIYFTGNASFGENKNITHTMRAVAHAGCFIAQLETMIEAYMRSLYNKMSRVQKKTSLISS